MPRDEFSEMRAFLEVAQERSFRRAAAKLGVTPSALSHTIRSLEERLGIRLLSRTTRDVAPTLAGARLMEGIEPHFAGIAAEVSAMGALRDKPSGSVRIVCTDDAVDTIFRPRLMTFLRIQSSSDRDRRHYARETAWLVLMGCLSGIERRQNERSAVSGARSEEAVTF